MLEEIRVKVMERMNQMREFSEKWITDVSPMAMDILRKNVEITDNCEVKFNDDLGFGIHDPPYSDEPIKKKFGKATRKGRKMKCFECKTFGHNKKGCPTLKNAGTSNIGTSVATARTNVVTVGTSAAIAGTNAATSDFTNAAIGSQSSVNAGPSAATASTLAGRPTNVSSSGVRHATTSTICGRPTNASSSGVRAAAASTFGVRPTTTPLRTQLLV
ncbi:uncharacterized protein [Solanum tuberosum]|uniref:uncharacterized protein n=1 Tax=Solanum tuberosum TaxID=4113 RepID=UPI00073A1A3F|nr:PREDICTED: uncharacterized protein LOC107061794 [Solanum tuberosum]